MKVRASSGSSGGGSVDFKVEYDQPITSSTDKYYHTDNALFVATTTGYGLFYVINGVGNSVYTDPSNRFTVSYDSTSQMLRIKGHGSYTYHIGYVDLG